MIRTGSLSELARSVVKVVAPPPDLTVSQWADRERRLSSESSAEPGRWRTSRAPYQREIMDALNDPATETIVVMSSAQVGKALAIDTPIPTPHGWTTMKEVKAGDLVFDENGEPCKITFATDVMYGRECYRVVFSDGAELIADADHQWYVESDTALIRGDRWHGSGAQSGVLTTEQMLADYKYGPKGSRNRYAIPVAKPLRTPPIDLPVDPYVLGVWLGDGHSLSASITCHEDDVLHFKAEIEAAGHVVREYKEATAYTLKIDKRERHICIRGHDKNETGWYGSHGCAECARIQAKNRGRIQRGIKPPEDLPPVTKTLYRTLSKLKLIGNKHIPSKYLRSSYSQRLSLLQGLMDTDGYIDKTKGRAEFITTSKNLADGFAELLATLGIKFTVSAKQPTTTYKGKSVNGKKAWRFSFLVYNDMPIFRLKRKLGRMPSRDGRRTTETERRRVVLIEKVDSLPVKCIAVDSPSHLYLAGKSMIPTHNTEILLNIIGYYIDQDPAPILLLQPTLEMAEAFSKDRLAPMLRDTPALKGKVKDPRSRDSGNTLLHKQFPGGHITMAGGNSPASLASRPIRILLADEVDRYPVSAGSEGDPLSLAERRTSNFWNRKKVYVSTPGVRGMSRIEAAYENSTQEQWCLPCPSCGKPQPLTWAQLHFEDLTLECVHCGARHTEVAWKRQEGQWVARKEHRVRGFHLNALASPWKTWSAIVAEFKEAKRIGPEGLKAWVNTVLGETWEEEGDVVEEDVLRARQDHYGAEVPDGVLVLTAGVDTQDDRLEVEVVGWGLGKESWSIEYRTIYGDPGQNAVWEQLDEFLGCFWSFPSGQLIGISCTCIDSGGHFTDQVYRFCKVREHRRIFAIKGKGGPGNPAIVGKPTRNNRHRTALFTLGVDTLKELFFSRLKVEDPGPGYCHFPKGPEKGHDRAYYLGITSEKKMLRYRKGRPYIEWVKRRSGIRNEPLDCRIYATGALEIFNPDLEKLAKSGPQARRYAQNSPMTAQRMHVGRRRRVISKGIG